ncbi:carbohydrate-binding module family 21 protein [Piromyces sp. E2]|nr:carbohydrate-binding module family 21 protein [Piromyces sp. E2]|eukprot:OUM63288.1 carbohydrate-binding module family 21 protein [Piromyces sp. E2]
MIKSLSYNQNQETYSKSWDNNIPKCLNNKNSFDLNYDDGGKLKNDRNKLYRNNTYHGTEKKYLQENNKKKEKIHKNFDFKNMLKRKNTPSSLIIASSAPTSSPIEIVNKNKNKNLSRHSKAKVTMKNISNNYGKKNLDNKMLSCSVDDIYGIKPRSEFKAKTRLLKSLVENIEDDTEDTYYDTEYSERSFIENLSVCKSTSNGIVSESLNAPSISEITITPAVVSIINTNSEINDLKQDLERYTKKNVTSNSNKNNNSKSKFFGKKFFSRFKSFSWFDSQKRTNRKSSLSQSSTIDYSVTMDTLEESNNSTSGSSSSNSSIKEQTDNEKSEITLVSTRLFNFEFTALNSDSLSSKESNISKTFVSNVQESPNKNLSSSEKDEKQILDKNILLDNSKTSSEELNGNFNDENENKEDIISTTKFEINKNNLFVQNNSDDSSLFSSNSLNENVTTLSDIPINVSNEDDNVRNNIDNIYKIEKFDETQILSTSSPKLEAETEDDKKSKNKSIIEELNVITDIQSINVDKINYIEEEIEENSENDISSSDITSSSNIGILEYETESEVDTLHKMSNYDSEIEVEIIAISSPSSEDINSNSDDNTTDSSLSDSRIDDETVNKNEVKSIEVNNLDLKPMTTDSEPNSILTNDTQKYLNNMDSSMITQIDGNGNESDLFIYNHIENELDEQLIQDNIIDDANYLTVNNKNLCLNNTDSLSSSYDKTPIINNNQTHYNTNQNNNNNNNNKINTELITSDIIPLSINNTNLSEIDKNINLPQNTTTLNTTIDIPTTLTLSSKSPNITSSPTSHEILFLNNDDKTDLISELPSNSININNDENKNSSSIDVLNDASTLIIQTKPIDIENNVKNNSFNLIKEKDANNENNNSIDLSADTLNETVETLYSIPDQQSLTNDTSLENLNVNQFANTNDESKILEEKDKKQIEVEKEKENVSEIVQSPTDINIINIDIEKESFLSNENQEKKVSDVHPKSDITEKEEGNLDKTSNKIEDIRIPERNNSDNIDMINESIEKKNQLKSVLKHRNHRYSFPQCGNSLEMSLLTHIPLNQIGDKENKISIPGVETIVVRQRRKSVNFDRNAFEKVCYFTSTEKPKDIHSRDVQIKEDEQSSNSIQTLLNTEVQKLLSDEVTGKGEYSNLGKITDTIVDSPDSSEISEISSFTTNTELIKLTTEPGTLANLDIPSECKEKISKESLTSLTSLTSISDSISISKDSDSSESNTLSITIKAEIEQKIKNNCLLKDSSLKLNDPSSSWSPIPRNVIHLPKMKNKSKDWEPHIAIENFELAPRFEGQTQDMWDVLQVNLKVQNLDYHKKVFIRYTTDDWASYKEEEAKYSCCIRQGAQGINNDPNSNSYDQQKKVGLDRFIAKIDASDCFVLPECGRHTCMQRPTKMLLVARYEVLGNTYWDNNHFTDYQLELVRIPAGYDVPRHHGHSKAGDASIIACAACAEEKREAELAEIKKLQKEDEKEKEERRKVRHFGGGKALLSDNFSIMSASDTKDFSMDPNNIYAKEVMKTNEINPLASSQSDNEKSPDESQEIKKDDNTPESSVSSTLSKSQNTFNNSDNYQNYQNNMSSVYSYDLYASNYNSGMSGSSSLYSSNYSDVYTYGGGISPYDPSYYTSNYSYNPNPYSPYENNNMMMNSENKNNEKYGFGRSRSYSTGSIYSSDYYERKTYFGNDNPPNFSSNSTISNQNTHPTYNNKNNDENVSEKKGNTITTKNESPKPKHNNETMDFMNTSIKSNFNITSEYTEKENNNKSLNSTDDNTHPYSLFSFTNNYNCTYQYNYNYSFGTETKQDDPNTSNSTNTTNTSQPYNNKYNLYNYNSLYANSSMTDIYNGYSGYDSMDSSMMNDTNAFY